jgi:short-subunit dehydrogenase
MWSRDQRKERFRARYGPWAIVTGASSGIGRAIALRLADAGLNLVIVARRRGALDELAKSLTAKHDIEVRVLSADLAVETSVETIASATNDLDVGLLIASAGFGTSGPFLESKIEFETEMLSVNCRALLGTCHHFGHRFSARGRGGMILMSSMVGFQGMPFAAHYAATKAYVQTLAEALYVELAPLGIDVLAAAPGPVHSGFAARAGQRMGRALEPEDIAQPILDALGRKSTTLPGFLSKLLRYSIVPLPRWARVRIMGMVMEGMTKHRRGAGNPGSGHTGHP